MVARGEIVKDTCELCGFKSDTTYHGLPGRHMMFHAEDYSRRPPAVVRICVECHLRLHFRLKNPNQWKQHCLDIRRAPSRAWIAVSHNRGEERDPALCRAKTCGRFLCTIFGKPDIAPVDFTPDPGKWWENLGFDRELGTPDPPTPESGVRIILRYGDTDDIRSLRVTVERNASTIVQAPVPALMLPGF